MEFKRSKFLNNFPDIVKSNEHKWKTIGHIAFGYDTFELWINFVKNNIFDKNDINELLTICKDLEDEEGYKILSENNYFEDIFNLDEETNKNEWIDKLLKLENEIDRDELIKLISTNIDFSWVIEYYKRSSKKSIIEDYILLDHDLLTEYEHIHFVLFRCSHNFQYEYSCKLIMNNQELKNDEFYNNLFDKARYDIIKFIESNIEKGSFSLKEILPKLNYCYSFFGDYEFISDNLTLITTVDYVLDTYHPKPIGYNNKYVCKCTYDNLYYNKIDVIPIMIYRKEDNNDIECYCGNCILNDNENYLYFASFYNQEEYKNRLDVIEELTEYKDNISKIDLFYNYYFNSTKKEYLTTDVFYQENKNFKYIPDDINLNSYYDHHVFIAKESNFWKSLFNE